MSDNSDSADSCTIFRYSRCTGASSVSSTKSVMPMMAFIGVRISWLMLARKALFARLAASAASFAFCNSAWVCLRPVISRKTATPPRTMSEPSSRGAAFVLSQISWLSQGRR